MRTIEEIKDEIRYIEKELARFKTELFGLEFLGTDKPIYEDIQERIAQLQNEINSDIGYIKTVYNQLLAIKARAELLVRENANQESIEISEKVHEAFLLLIEFNKTLGEKIANQKALIEERDQLIQKSETTLPVKITETQEKLWTLQKELINAERQESISEKATSRIIEDLKTISETKHVINAKKEHPSAFCEKCNIKLVLEKRSNVYVYSCPNWKPGDPEGKHSVIWCNTDKEKNEAKKIFEDVEIFAKKQKEALTKIQLTDTEKEAFQNASLKFDEYPNILETDYNNYLFQSLAVPAELPIKDHFDELLKYSRFRIFTNLPVAQVISDRARTVYSLALRLLNRGVILNTNKKTAAKIKHYFEDRNASTALSNLNEYVHYESPQIQYDSSREVGFAQSYFPQTLGNAWATYVYPQMYLTSLLPEKHKKDFNDQRVDFFICYDDKKIVIELDGEEHKHSPKKEEDARRDKVLEQNGYTVLRFDNSDVDRRALQILLELDKYIKPASDGMLVPYSKKHLVACKVAHQITIAIVKMLEEGHIPSRCNLDIEISDNDLFSPEEKYLILCIAIEEAQELLENFAKLYGVDLDLDFFDESAEKYWIKIGDGDNNRNSIVIRDIVLPINYLCSIRQFALEMPEKNAVSEDILRYFLHYVYGYDKFRDGQFLAIRRALCQEESIVLLPTGSGKSVIYQLSSMLLPGITVVISPLRALIEDQVSNLADRGVYNVAAIYRADEESRNDMLKKAKAIMNNHSAMMLYIAPERIQMPAFRDEIDNLKISNNFCLIAIDEAHCVSEWGHDFRAAYLQIGRSCRRIFEKESFIPALVALTGTASDNVLRDVKRDLEIEGDHAIISPTEFDRPELHYSIQACPRKDKRTNTRKILNKILPEKFNISYDDFSKLQGDKTISGIIFTALAKKENSSHQTDAWNLFQYLQESKYLRSSVYFSRSPFEKSNNYTNDDSNNNENLWSKDDEIWHTIIKKNAKDFKENKLNILVATKAFGMGIDKPNIRFIIHNGLAPSIEQYYQEVGRAGRDRKDAYCVMLLSDDNSAQNEKLLNPNCDWQEFSNNYREYLSNKTSSQDDDISTLLYFYSENFVGPEHEKEILKTIWRLLSEESNHTDETDWEISFSVASIVHKLTLKINRKNEDNFVAKAVIRLNALGIIKDYTYDYSKKAFAIVLGSFDYDKILENYFKFVDGCSYGKSYGEKLYFNTLQNSDSNFIELVLDRYVDLVYGTIEKGRRRALHSMYRLAKEASLKAPQEQDNYIRSTIQNYLTKSDTAKKVKNREKEAGIAAGVDEIFYDFPLYSHVVNADDDIERKQALKTQWATKRILDEGSDSPGLHYLYAITAIKSANYNDDVIDSIAIAYKKFAMRGSKDKALEILVKVMNLTFNASSELFERLWDKLMKLNETGLKQRIVKKALELSGDDVSQDFKDYLTLHVAVQALHKMTGDI